MHSWPSLEERHDVHDTTQIMICGHVADPCHFVIQGAPCTPLTASGRPLTWTLAKQTTPVVGARSFQLAVAQHNEAVAQHNSLSWAHCDTLVLALLYKTLLKNVTNRLSWILAYQTTLVLALFISQFCTMQHDGSQLLDRERILS